MDLYNITTAATAVVSARRERYDIVMEQIIIKSINEILY